VNLLPRPTPLEILQAVQHGLRAHVLPELQSDQARADLAAATGLLAYLAREFDGAAQSLLDEIADLETVASAAVPALRAAGHEPEAAALEAATLGDRAAPTDVRVSTLLARHDALEEALLAALLVADHTIEAGDASLGATQRAIRGVFVRLNARRLA
jgi:hypothetical protein